MAHSYYFLYSFFDLNYDQESFRFFNGPDTLGVCIKQPITTKEELITALAEGFQYPYPIEPSWEFLKKMLWDLSWSPYFPLVLAHRMTPLLPKQELLIYFDILDQAARRSEEKRDILYQKKFQILFPSSLISVLQLWERQSEGETEEENEEEETLA